MGGHKPGNRSTREEANALLPENSSGAPLGGVSASGLPEFAETFCSAKFGGDRFKLIYSEVTMVNISGSFIKCYTQVPPIHSAT